MLTVAAETALGPAADAAGTRSIEILSGFGAAEPLWRAFERDAAATPYQRFDWVAAHGAEETRIAAIRGPGGGLDVLWPLALGRRLGLRVATGIGGKHANFNMPLFRPGLRLAPDEARELVKAIGRTIGVDAVAIRDMPARWGGEDTPFAALGRPGPNVAPEVRLDPDPEATARRSMSNEARKRLRNKERGVAKLGPLAVARAETEGEVDRLLAAFFRQKEDRFGKLSIPDPFLDGAVRSFLRRAATERLATGDPAIEIWGMTVGDRVAAVLGCAADGRRLSGMFISFEDCPEITRFSPGDILVARVVRDQCLMGRGHFDLGTGEARYKRIVCDEEMALLDLFVPVTARGRLMAGATALAVAAKRRFKASPAAMRGLAAFRRLKGAIRD